MCSFSVFCLNIVCIYLILKFRFLTLFVVNISLLLRYALYLLSDMFRTFLLYTSSCRRRRRTSDVKVFETCLKVDKNTHLQDNERFFFPSDIRPKAWDSRSSSGSDHTVGGVRGVLRHLSNVWVRMLVIRLRQARSGCCIFCPQQTSEREGNVLLIIIILLFSHHFS